MKSRIQVTAVTSLLVSAILYRARRRCATAATESSEVTMLLSELRSYHRGVWIALSDSAGESLRWPLVARFLKKRMIDQDGKNSSGACCEDRIARHGDVSSFQDEIGRVRLLRTLLTFLRGHVGDGGLEVKPSTVPAAGQGLFATRPFPKGTLLCVYRGTSVSLVEAMRRKARGEHGDYVMGGFGANVRLDAGPHPEVLARYINDDLSGTPRYNVKFVKLKLEQCALVVALRDIQAGEELFAFYGEGYWKVRHR